MLSVSAVMPQDNVLKRPEHSSEYKSFLKDNVPWYVPDYSTDTKVLDIPLVSGIVRFHDLIYKFNFVMLECCVVFMFLCIVFGAIKMWAGTIEVKKMVVDLIYKTLFCLFLVLYFPTITDEILRLSTSWGTTMTGGKQHIESTFKRVYVTLDQNIKLGLDKIIPLYMDNVMTSKDGKKYMTDTDVAKIMAYGADSYDAVRQMLSEQGIGIATFKDEVDFSKSTYSTYGTTIKRNTGWFDDSGQSIDFAGMEQAAHNIQNLATETTNVFNGRRKKQKQYVSKLNALMEVLGETALDNDQMAENEEQIKTRARGTLGKLFYTPFLVNRDLKDTFFLSPSTMIKTVSVMTDVMTYACGKDTDGDDEIEAAKLNPKGEWYFGGILRVLFIVIYQLGMLVGVVFVMAEYTITILEFYIVRSLCMLLIPMMFLDATKSFAQNILRICLTYFFKIFTTAMMCFFVLGMFMDTLETSFTNGQLTATLTMVSYLSTIITGCLLVFSTAKIASTVITGNPAMGVGDVVNMGRSTMHAMHTAGHAARSVGRGIAATHAMAQAGRRGAATVGAWKKAAAAEGEKAMSALKKSNAEGATSLSDRDIAKAGKAASRDVMGAAFRQAAGDAAYKFAFGKERPHTNEDGSVKDDRFFKVGEKSERSDQFGINRGMGDASSDDVARKATAAADGIGKNAVMKAIDKSRRKDGLNSMNGVNETAEHPKTAEELSNLYYGQ